MFEKNILLILFEGYLLLYLIKTERSKKVFFVLVCLQAILLSGLRHIEVGIDTPNYYNMFQRTKNQSWGLIFSHFLDFANYSDYGMEPGYVLSVKIFQIFSQSFRTYLMVLAIFVNVSIFYIMYKNKVDGLLGSLVYMCQYYAFVSTTGIRQTIAYIVLCFLCLDWIKKRKLVPFLCAVAVCYLFHRSALAFIPMYFIANKKLTTRYLIIMAGICAMTFTFTKEFTAFIAATGGYEHYGEGYDTTETAYNFIALNLAILGVSLWRMKKLVHMYDDAQMYINASLFGAILLPMVNIDPSNIRVVFYYSMYQMFLVPMIPHTFGEREREIVLVGIIGILLLMYLKGYHPYSFLWQPGIFTHRPSPV